jgi:hypothetical protein
MRLWIEGNTILVDFGRKTTLHICCLFHPGSEVSEFIVPRLLVRGPLTVRALTYKLNLSLCLTKYQATKMWFVLSKYHAMNTKTVWKVCRLTLLLRLGTSWRCGDGLFFELPPLASDAFLTTLRPLLENVLQTVNHFEISCLGAPFSWLEKPRNRMGRDLDCMAVVLMGFHRSTFSKPNTEFNSDLVPCDFWAFPTMKRELWGKKFRSDQRSAGRFREVGGVL